MTSAGPRSLARGPRGRPARPHLGRLGARRPTAARHHRIGHSLAHLARAGRPRGRQDPRGRRVGACPRLGLPAQPAARAPHRAYRRDPGPGAQRDDRGPVRPSVHPRAAERPKFEVSRNQLVWPNGAIAQIFAADDPDSLRGPQFDAAWCDELCKWRRPERAWNNLQFALRLGSLPQCGASTTRTTGRPPRAPSCRPASRSSISMPPSTRASPAPRACCSRPSAPMPTARSAL